MTLYITLAVLLFIPLLLWIVNRYLLSSKLKMASVAAISAMLVYIFILASVAYIGQKLDAELAAFDLNEDGVFSGDEITVEQEEAMRQVVADTGRTLAPFTGAIFSFVYCMGVWFVLAILSWLGRRLVDRKM